MPSAEFAAEVRRSEPYESLSDLLKYDAQLFDPVSFGSRRFTFDGYARADLAASYAIPVSDRRGPWDSRTRARSSRSRLTNCARVSPSSARNTRWKWNGEKQATRAMSSSCSGWSRFCRTWSIARLTRCT